MADKRISQLVDRGTVANNDVVPIVVSGATTTNKATISSIQTFMQGNLDLGVTSVGITLGSSGTDVSVSGSPITSSGNITINLPTASATNRGLLSAADWSTFNNKQGAITLTTTGTSGVSTLVGSTLNIPNYTTDLSGYVTLGTAQTITAQKTFTTSGSSDTMIISHGSGSGFALDVLKAGNGEAIRVTKSSGTGNAMTISGGNFEAGTIVKTGGTSSQFLKADGSVDSSSYALNSSLNLYLPLTGGTISGQLNVGSGNLRIAAEGASNITILRNFTGTAQGQSGFNNIGFNNSNNFYFTKNLNNGCIFSFNNTAYRTYTFPDSDATIASTSNLAAYLPLTGGTLTGALNGTSAVFSGTVTAATLSTIGTAVAGQNVQLNLNGVSGKAQRIEFQNSGVQQWLLGAGAASETSAFELFNSTGVITLSINKSTNAATFSSSVTSSFGSGGANFNSNAGTTGSVNAYRVSHSNGIGSFGLEANAGGDLMIGGLANATLLQSVSNTPLQLGTNQTARLTILSNGNVGIGTASPGRLLTLYKSSTPILQFVDDASGTGASNGFLIYNGGVNAYLQNISNGFMSFQTNDTERMRITSGGIVDIAGPLVIRGTLPVDQTSAAVIDHITSKMRIFSYGASGTTGTFEFRNAAGGAGSNLVATINASGVYTALSDINKKKDFEESPIGLNEILQLKPTLYRMLNDESEGQKELGFIAQEVNEFIPHAYVESGEEEEKFIGLNYNPIVAALVKAIQEQQEQIDSLKNQIK